MPATGVDRGGLAEKRSSADRVETAFGRRFSGKRGWLSE
ncbi:hypothetical protein BN903_49 [Halorubrum sp. AJ67]|nr:hypothetical protein BN903_49 [Halorubrum sp. AJ67]